MEFIRGGLRNCYRIEEEIRLFELVYGRRMRVVKEALLKWSRRILGRNKHYRSNLGGLVKIQALVRGRRVR